MSDYNIYILTRTRKMSKKSPSARVTLIYKNLTLVNYLGKNSGGTENVEKIFPTTNNF